MSVSSYCVSNDDGNVTTGVDYATAKRIAKETAQRRGMVCVICPANLDEADADAEYACDSPEGEAVEPE